MFNELAFKKNERVHFKNFIMIWSMNLLTLVYFCMNTGTGIFREYAAIFINVTLIFILCKINISQNSLIMRSLRITYSDQKKRRIKRKLKFRTDEATVFSDFFKIFRQKNMKIFYFLLKPKFQCYVISKFINSSIFLHVYWTRNNLEIAIIFIKRRRTLRNCTICA